MDKDGQAGKVLEVWGMGHQKYLPYRIRYHLVMSRSFQLVMINEDFQFCTYTLPINVIRYV